MQNPEIDYSAVHPVEIPAPEDWDPPRHVFFGKKLPNGKSEKEPVYVHQEYPRIMYARPDADKAIITKVVNSDAELQMLGDGWVKNPIALGYIGAPSQEEHLRLQGSQVIAMQDAQNAKMAAEAAQRTEAAMEAAQREADERIRLDRETAEKALQDRIAAAVAAALPGALAAALDQEKRGPGRPKGS